MANLNNKTNKIILIVLVSLAISMVLTPSQTYNSALRGLNLWWEVVTPALLPFFFLSELLMELNISRYLTFAMSPLMRPLFALPGSASLAVALGFCSGFPSGAVITAALRRKNEISRSEGERLICFTNNASPLYISVAVAGGLLHCPRAAILLFIVHYGGNLLIGIMSGLIARCKTPLPREKKYPVFSKPAENQFSSNNFGRILKAAASRATANITAIGCLMIFFSVFTGVLYILPIPDIALFKAYIQGFWEMSLGINALADSGLPLQQTIPAAAAILGFGGLSVQMQVLAMIGDTDIRILPYLATRLFHALLSYTGASLLCSTISLPVATFVPGSEVINYFWASSQIWLTALAALICVSCLMLLLRPLCFHRHRK